MSLACGHTASKLGRWVQTQVLVTPKTESSLTGGLEITANVEMGYSDPASRKDTPVNGVLVVFNNWLPGGKCVHRYSQCSLFQEVL